MRRFIVHLALLCLTLRVMAQTHSYVSIDRDDVYAVLESLERRGLTPPLVQPRPFPASRVADLLEGVLAADPDRLGSSERATLEGMLKSFRPEAAHSLGALVRTDVNLSVSDPGRPHAINGLGLTYGGDVFDGLSLYAEFSLLVDAVNEDAFLPFEFTKNWDHHHIGTFTRSDNDVLFNSNRTENDMVFSGPDGRLFVRVGRYRRDWGPGQDSLLLSGTARPFDGLETGVALGTFGYFSSVTGSLGATGSSSVTADEQKMLSAHRLTLTPFPWLSFSFWESVIWGKRFELAYLSPVSIYLISQMATAGDLDNSTMGFDVRARLPGNGSWFGSLFIDEIDHTRMLELFSFPKNIFAFYTGVDYALTALPFGFLRLQYTKLEPFVYTHYPEDRYPFFKDGTVVNINYTHDGANLGYPLPPNSDQFLAVFRAMPWEGVWADLSLSYVRHGDNPGVVGYVIRGDIDEDLDYAHLGEYPDKDFLRDGVYEHILSASVRATWRPGFADLSLYAGIGAAWARNYGCVAGNRASFAVFSLGGRYVLPVVTVDR